MSLHHVFVAILFLVGLAAPAPAAPPASSPVERGDGEEHDRRGKVLYGKGDLEGALAEFRAAYAADARPAFLFNAAKTLERLERTREAFETYDEYLRVAPGAAEREAAAGVLAGLCPDVGRGLVRVASEPKGALVSVDGVVFPVPADTTLCLTPGRHELTAARKGFEVARRSVEATAGASTDVRFALARALGNGTVRVVSEVLPATVLLDGVRVGDAPVDVAVPAGSPHELTVDAGEAWLPWRRTVEVKEGHAISVRALSERRPATPATQAPVAPTSDDGSFNWGWVALGTSAALAVTGAVLYGVAYDRVQTADGLDPTRPDYDSRFDDLSGEGQRLQIGAFVTWGLAAVAGLTAPLVWTGDEPAAKGARAPVRTPLVGLTIGGTF